MLLGLVLGAWRSSNAETLPAPAYANTLHAYTYVDPPLLGSEAGIDGLAAALAAVGLVSGPYVTFGAADYFIIAMPWGGPPDPDDSLTSPTEGSFAQLLARLESHGLSLHLSAMFGMSRAPFILADAKREDRRNAQWFDAGQIGPWPASTIRGTDGCPSVTPAESDTMAQVTTAWVTPSRYARRLRRHLEARARALGRLLVRQRRAHPNALFTASGDAEAELSDERSCGPVDATHFRQLVIADYSPFAILEFRDWLLGTGLYAPGGPYAGDAYVKRSGDGFAQGGDALTPQNLAAFNASFATAFQSWELRYFPWSLDDPIDSDPHALPHSEYGQAGFDPTPDSGARATAGGFDAPRGTRPTTSTHFWQVWFEFREAMLAHHGRDIARWVTTSADSGETWPAERWFLHQIPGDYLGGKYPGHPVPELRLLSSASPLASAFVSPLDGTPGWTILDAYFGGADPACSGQPPGNCYVRTSAALFANSGIPGGVPGVAGAIGELQLPSWGAPEFAPSWWINAIDTDVERIRGQYHRALATGLHMFSFTPFSHLTDYLDQFDQNGQALALFLADVADFPRQAVTGTTYVPPAPADLAGTTGGAGVSLSWRAQLFADSPGLDWSTWSVHTGFEIWCGYSSEFDFASGHLLRTLTGHQASGGAAPFIDPVLGACTHFKVAALSTGGRGPLSAAAAVAPPSAASYNVVAPCRVLDTRCPTPGLGCEAVPVGGPALAGGTPREIVVAGQCGVPVSARSVALNVTIAGPTQGGFLTIYPADLPFPVASSLNFRPGQVRANNVVVALSGAGRLRLLGGYAVSSTSHVLVDVTGWYE